MDTEKNIRLLSGKFARKGEDRNIQFTQINRTDRAYLYEVRIDGKFSHYVVFIRKINKRFRCESYPTMNAFGIWAWTYTCLGKAIQRLNSL